MVSIGDNEQFLVLRHRIGLADGIIVTMFAARTTRRLLKRTKRHEIGRVSRGAVCPPADGSPRVFFMVFFEYQRKKMVRK